MRLSNDGSVCENILPPRRLQDAPHLLCAHPEVIQLRLPFQLGEF